MASAPSHSRQVAVADLAARLFAKLANAQMQQKRMIIARVALVAVFITFAVAVLLPAARAEEAVDFAREVKPILTKHCFACHGPDAKAREADLRLDRENAEARKLISPGNPGESDLLNRVASLDPDVRMPPPDSGPALKPQEIDTLRRWIKAEARYEIHWALRPLTRPALPLSERKGNEIDAFVLAQMQSKGLTPEGRADPYTLARRVYLDLIGLPPTPEEADAFAANPSDEAWNRLIQRLLDSPRFGEHWARMWLDLARYADTKGYEKDQPRKIWRYRDWVIDALNADMPFDQFTREQLAGDLLPDATTEQILATAFHRNTMTNDEGGTDNEEFRLAAVKDRVDTTVQVWMGLTMGCAKCHSHKYDPISQEEYYRFLAFFNQTEDADRSDDAPRLETPTGEQRRQRAALTKQLESLRQRFLAPSPELDAAQAKWEQELAANPLWRIAEPVKASAKNGTTLTIQPDGSVLASGTMPGVDVYSLELRVQVEKPIHAIRLEAMTHASLPKKGPGRNASDPNFVLSELTAWRVTKVGDPLEELKWKAAKASFSQRGWPVAKAIDGDSDTGWAISPQQGKPHTAIFSFDKPQQFAAGSILRLQLSQQYQPNSLLLGRVRVSLTTHEPSQLQPEDSSPAELAAIANDKRTPDQTRQLLEAFRKTAPQTASIRSDMDKVRKDLEALAQQIPRTPVMRDLPENRQRKTFLHIRGNFLQPGDEVAPGFPESLSFLGDDFAPNRTAVVEWLVSKRNPLTARVMANRVWARIFGRGLVVTEEDFGVQGEPPSHPLLLDWLSTEFRDRHAWSLKSLCRTIVLSETYRRDSRTSDANRERDPDNLWLSRGRRFRLPAETIRDQALASARLLSPKIGGPSVMPPQPEGIWRTTYSKLKWSTADGEDRYRRGIYTFLRRTSPYPSMLTFDAGSREVCQFRRVRTNTPLQALVTMNDPVYIEAAGALAQSTLAADTGAWSEAMFRRALIRKPNAAENERLIRLFQDAAASFGERPEGAGNLLQAANIEPAEETPQALRSLAAATVVANVILNLDETLMRP